MAELNKSNPPDNVISAKDIVHQYNITYQTVNHYTDFGLLPVLMKRGNVRFYDGEVIEKRMKQIEELKKEGYSLRLIRKKLIGI
jgi:DNA-binding transcriptional MerR regulator